MTTTTSAVRFCYNCQAHQMVDKELGEIGTCTVCGGHNIDLAGTDFPDPENSQFAARG